MAADIVTIVLCCIGVFFFVVGTTGLLRMPDVFSRLHPSTKCDTLGACSVVIGLMFQSGWSFATLKLLLIVFFLLISSATCGHAIGRSALKRGILPWGKKSEEGR